MHIWASQAAQWVKNLTDNTGHPRVTGSIPGSERFSGVGNVNLYQYSCLGNLMDRETWRAIVLEVTKSWTQLSTHIYILYIAEFCLAKDFFFFGIYISKKYLSIVFCFLMWFDLRFCYQGNISSKK